MLSKLLTKIGAKLVSKYAPKPDPDQIAISIAKALQGTLGQTPSGVRVHAVNRITGEVIKGGLHEVPRGEPIAQAHVELTPPPPAKDMPPSCSGWTEYRAAMESTRIDGWAFGRMGCESVDDEVTFFFGNLKGDYGIFTMPMPICWDGEPPHDKSVETNQGDDPILAQLVHLPTGVGMGVFENRHLASAAADALEKSGFFARHTYLPRDQWDSRKPDIENLWRFHGIGVADYWHAHPMSGRAVSIYTNISMDADKPEKAS